MVNGKGIAYAALILGLIGAGLGGYTFFDNTIAPMLGFGEPTPEINSWYVEDYSIIPSATGTYVPLTGMLISFDTTKTVTLHILYTAYVRITIATGTYAQIIIRLNSTTLTENYYYVEKIGATLQERFAVNIQDYVPALAPGSYNVTVYVWVDDVSTLFYMNSLYVQTHT
jgi:hypothetical protein